LSLYKVISRFHQSLLFTSGSTCAPLRRGADGHPRGAPADGGQGADVDRGQQHERWGCHVTPGGCQIGYMRDQNSTYGLHSLPGGVRFVTWTPYWFTGCHQPNRVLTTALSSTEPRFDGCKITRCKVPTLASGVTVCDAGCGTVGAAQAANPVETHSLKAPGFNP
jgi:hypothetical protein